MSEFGRRRPTDWKHVEKYALTTLIEDPDHPLTIPATGVEKSLGLPVYWKLWDQGNEGACVGWASSAATGITNTVQNHLATGSTTTLRFAPHWLYEQAQLVDEFPDTPPAEGTTVRAAYDVLRAQGHRRVVRGVAQPPDLKWGVVTTRWAKTVDEIRAAIYGNLAVSFGIDWYRSFQNERLIMVGGERTIAGISGTLLGGHDICLFRMSDKRQAFKLMNSWGADYPPAWMPYQVAQKLLDDYGEAAVITDR